MTVGSRSREDRHLGLIGVGQGFTRHMRCKQMIIKRDHDIKVGKGRVGVMGSQRIEDLQHLKNYLGGDHKLSVLESWHNYQIGVDNSDDKVQDTWMGNECRVEDMIIGLEKPVSWMNHSVMEDRHRAGASDPETLALMNGEE